MRAEASEPGRRAKGRWARPNLEWLEPRRLLDAGAGTRALSPSSALPSPPPSPPPVVAVIPAPLALAVHNFLASAFGEQGDGSAVPTDVHVTIPVPVLIEGLARTVEPAAPGTTTPSDPDEGLIHPQWLSLVPGRAAPGTAAPPPLVATPIIGPPSAQIQEPTAGQPPIVIRLASPHWEDGWTGPTPSGMDLVPPLEADDGVEKLPDTPVQSVRGTLDPDRLQHIYRFPIDPWTSTVEIDFHPGGGSGPGHSALEMVVYDADGRPLCELRAGSGSSGMAMNLDTTGAPSESAIFVKVGYVPTAPAPAPAPDPGGTPQSTAAQGGSPLSAGSTSSAAPPLDFLLTVQRQYAPAEPGSTSPDAVEVAPDPGPAPPAQVVLTSGPDEVAPAASDGAGDAANAATGLAPGVLRPGPGPVPVAVGRLPGRAASPLGGVLAKDDPAPEADQRDPAVVDLALIEMPPGAADVPAHEAGGTDGPAPTPDGVVAGRGPGGFPLLGSSLLTQPQPDRTARLPLPVALDHRRRNGPTAGPSFDPAGLAGPDVGHVSAAAPTRPANDPAAMLRAKSVRRTSILAGLSVALTFTLSLTLPEMTDPLRREADNPRSWLRGVKPRRPDV